VRLRAAPFAVGERAPTLAAPASRASVAEPHASAPTGRTVMAQPPDRHSEGETEEIDREMEMIEREGGGVGEAAPFRRLVLVVVTAALVFLALWYFWR